MPHFRTQALRDAGGWDPYNVTEDTDLSMRLARRGLFAQAWVLLLMPLHWLLLVKKR